jgi:predicted ATPase/class 3 adenylate cyclase
MCPVRQRIRRMSRLLDLLRSSGSYLHRPSSPATSQNLVVHETLQLSYLPGRELRCYLVRQSWRHYKTLPKHKFNLICVSIRLEAFPGKIMQPEYSSPQSKVVTFPVEELPFTDRVVELRKLKSSIQRIGEFKEGTIVLISGEPGVGKTRLCLEASKFAQSKNFRCLFAKCTKGEDLAPYSPWIQLLRDFASQASIQLFYKVSGPYLNEIVRLIPELAENASNLTASQALAPSTEEATQRRLQFFQSLSQFFVRLANESPLVLVFDDLQWADPVTIQLLRFFRATAMNAAPILILALYRDYEVSIGENPSVASMVKELENDRRYMQVRLQRLDNSNVGELLATISGDQKISDEFRELIYAKTGGNPFFIEEVLRSLVERGDVFRNERGLWDRKPIQEILIPQSIQGLIKQRIDRLDNETREILKIASVMGEVFELQILEKVAHEIADESRLTGALATALAAGFLRKKQEVNPTRDERGIFAFSDESVYEVLNDELDRASLQEFHLKTAKALEELSSNSFTNGQHQAARELGFHFLMGGDLARALEYTIKAGDGAASLFAHDEASKHYAQALEIMTRVAHDPITEANVLYKMADERWLAGDPTSLENWKKSAEIFERIKGYEKFASEAYRKIAFVYGTFLVDKDGEIEYSNKAIQILEALPPSEALARAYIAALVPYCWSGEIEKASQFLQKATELAGKLNSPVIRAWTSYARVEVADVAEKDEVLRNCQEAIEFLVKNNQIYEAGHAHYHRVLWYTEIKGATKETLDAVSQAEEYCNKVGNYISAFALKASRFTLFVEWGELEKAKEIADSILELSQRATNTRLIRANYLRSLGEFLSVRGELDKAEESFRESIRLSRDFGLANGELRNYVGLVRVLLCKRDYVNAEKVLSKGYGISKKWGFAIPNVMRYVQLLSLWVELDLAAKKEEGKEKQAKDHLEELRTASNRIGEEWAVAQYLRAQGMLQTLENNSEALDSYQKSIEIWRKLQWPYELGKTLYLLANEYYAENDPIRAKAQLHEALEIFKGFGAKHDEQECVVLQEKIERAVASEKVLSNKRGLAAIMFTDIVGYTKLAQENEALALALLEEHRNILRPIFKRHFGREVEAIGDAFLVEFASALEAARCAVNIQASLGKRTSSISTSPTHPSLREQRQLKIRIGIHLGDVERKDGDIYGDAVNIASRIEPLAVPGGVCITQQVYDQIRNYTSEFSFQRLGARDLKNVNLPYEVYQIVLSSESVTDAQ